MIESIFITLFPIAFLFILFGGGNLFHKKHADVDGKPPIKKVLFLSSKYLIILLWAGMILQTWGVNISMITIPASVRYISLILWFSGFVLLFIGKQGLGASFRIGQPEENTQLKTGGFFRFSRNPMYVGVYFTIIAVILYTANLIVLLTGIYVVVIHDLIILSEEAYLRQKFGKEYRDYCAHVRRYV